MKLTNYAEAVKGFQKVIFNQIHEIDPYACENMTDNYYHYWDDDEPNHDPCSDSYEYPEIYQYFVTDLSDGAVHYLENRYNLLFMKSYKLDLWILCVPHYGTAWDYVEWEDRG